MDFGSKGKQNKVKQETTKKHVLIKAIILL